MSTTPVDIIHRAIAGVRGDVVHHPIADAIRRPESARIFMEHHVFAVWGFMFLLGGLRQRFTCWSIAWTPPVDAEAARLVNEIVLGEESDVAPYGHGPHLAWYVDAMNQLGADTDPILAAIDKVRGGADPIEAATEAGAPPAAIRFLANDWRAANADAPTLVGAFTFGRETLIPAMFGPILDSSEGSLLRGYLERHIEVDEHHGHLAEILVGHACGGDSLAVLAAIDAARRALYARRDLWNAALAAITKADTP